MFEVPRVNPSQRNVAPPSSRTKRKDFVPSEYYKSGLNLQPTLQPSSNSGRILNTESNFREDSSVSLGIASAGILSNSATVSQANATIY